MIKYYAYAGVVELVDALDSKSSGAQTPCRFEPDRRHFLILTIPSSLIYTYRLLSSLKKMVSSCCT